MSKQLFDNPQGNRGNTVVHVTFAELYGIVREKLNYFHPDRSDPDAFCQDMCVRIEKAMDIFPNIDGPMLGDTPEPLKRQIDRLANFIMEEIPGEPSQSECAVDTAIRWMKSAARRAPAPAVEVKVPQLEKYSRLKPREFLLITSYCGDDTPGCSDERPCVECLSMCNVFAEDGSYLRQLGALSAAPSGEEQP